jgi:hypothetical protein
LDALRGCEKATERVAFDGKTKTRSKKRHRERDVCRRGSASKD